MKRWFLAWGIVASVAAALATSCSSQLLLDSTIRNGEIQWQVPQTPSTCRVEWATSADGPWYSSWDSLRGMVATSSTARTVFPLFFRVVQPLTWAEEGLVFWMPCNGDLRDHSPFGNHPMPTGTVDLQSDRGGNPGRSLRLDLGEFLTVAGGPSLVATNVTLALWAKFDSLASWPYLLEMGPHDSIWSLFVDQVGTTPNPGWWCLRGGAAVPFVRVEEILQTNRWYHLAATIRGTQAILYQDGVSRRTGTVAAVKTTIDRLYIGRTALNHTSPTNWHFQGNMDDIRIYNRLLNATEIAALQALAP